MAIIFTKKKKNQNIFLIISFLIIGACLIYLGQIFIKKEIISFPIISFTPTIQEVKIDFEVLKKMNEFQPFPLIQPFEETILTSETGEVIGETKKGRENPFIPY